MKATTECPVLETGQRAFGQSHRMREKSHRLIPGGAHTYAKGDDQFPKLSPGFVARGQGCRVWDVDGNEYIEYGMGLRAVTLGHAYEPVVEAAYRQMQLGINFTRPASIEVELAEAMLGIVDGADMVKFAKNGSDVTTAAVKLARAYTGRDLVALCSDHPFFSIDDWFIGTTEVNAGIPAAINELTVKFRYNNIQSLRELFARYPGRIACVLLEPETAEPPRDNFLGEVKSACEEHGAVFVLDEMITGFRWHLGGGQKFHQVQPHLSTFGKAMGNGFAIAALAGKRDLMRLGGLDHDRPRVFLLSTTHGAETHALAASLEIIRVYHQRKVVEHLWRQGARLHAALTRAIRSAGVNGFFELAGRPCNLVYGTKDETGQRSQAYRALFLQELIRRGVLAPSFVVSFSHDDQDIDQTAEIAHDALCVYRKALDEGVEKYLVGGPVKPVYRRYN